MCYKVNIKLILKSQYSEWFFNRIWEVMQKVIGTKLIKL
jgi:hypothetical protein